MKNPKLYHSKPHSVFLPVASKSIPVRLTILLDKLYIIIEDNGQLDIEISQTELDA
jgi:hypothetical protein